MPFGDYRDFIDFVPFQWGTQTACGFSWDEKDVIRFLSKLSAQPHPTDPNKVCLIWAGGRSRGRGNTAWYGSFWTKGKTIRAHKFGGVAIMGLRPVRGEHHLDHECVNSLCVSCVRVTTILFNLKRRWGRHED